ncbi:GTPase [Blautia coccoides]|nr:MULTISPECIES: GTPase [Blautia]MCB5873692.1 GTPase [Blautia producta]MCB6784553.1 GTPase [Blautia producta]MCQ4641674.1 GTPase [Blautia coccoides]MCQ5124799.1 GTPase [Blautia producta]MDT4374384.1 GTPase [Blautia coccoides]
MKDITTSVKNENSENCHRGGGKGQGNGNGGKGGSKDIYHVESSSSDDLDGQAAMEMTGLMYKPPVSEAELESYKEVYPFSPEEYTEE